MAKIEIDKVKCIGCGLCENLCPLSFKMDKDKAIVIREKVDDLTNEKEAEECCPTQAIKITD